ncbi:DNA polymerase III subunit delta' [Gilvimarinus agarilyticus]|uniref:DNA polymerase III subunit delta' n=1 Tax=Gilvimarinus agarilyticus TaxID=679259 RepID=UPI0005A1B04C|nr:DNA polymerase III subunit delta' [Gilvimarinus agarilyticus]
MSDFPALPYPWQQEVWQGFIQQFSDNRLPHALMLAGSPGLGKRHLARAMAQYVLCQRPVSESACGKCKSCELNRAGTHPDLIQLAPAEPGKAIRVDDVRALTEAQGKTAQQSGYKVVTLMPAEAMNSNAANALLKTLEEPAADTLLILVTDAPSGVLPTIRSRCQLRTMAIPPNEQSLHWLTPLVSGSGHSAAELLALTRGAPLAARDLLEGDALDLRARWSSDLIQLTLGQTDTLSVAAGWQKGDGRAVLEWFSGWLHDLACWQVGAERARFADIDPGLTSVLKGISPSLLHRFQEKLLHSKKLLNSGANPNVQLLLEELLMDWGVLLRARAG